MRFVSTRGTAPAVDIDSALASGLAPDGGLYVPETIPAAPAIDPSEGLARTAATLLAPYFEGSRIAEALPAICDDAFDFPAPLQALAADTFVLELFHGPTAAFKDFGARFLARALEALRRPDDPEVTILVATSGDTGAAVAAAFHRRPGFRVVILYPDGRVSPRQAHGLGCWGDNVRALRVAGTFDDCQRLVKQALGDTALRNEIALGSANSISLGRLLPQAAYYAQAALQFQRDHGERLNFVIPTGNLGNATACWLARRMGLPIGDIVLACNANDVLPRYFDGADYRPAETRATLANAMDVGAPSNFERLRHAHADDAALRQAMRAASVDDAQILATIERTDRELGYVPCPHTATAIDTLHHLRGAGDTRPWAVVATAHAAKFETVVEPRIGRLIAPPPALADCLARPAHADPLPADYDALRAVLRP
ncbi:threonine synthase [Lysobacter sp. TY2-98]|uniref:threonine synthase n=1 Tax=Lysobacter sp. TY2-98 TaxID=2290922 RepID=UPI000E20C702|nr:threonine synthase [Lysobacter sp. TY2-98]AXK72640.1 threonine synthase [Lysobacter sp. TY2-98]